MSDIIDDFLDMVPWAWITGVLGWCLLLACATELEEVRTELKASQAELVKYKLQEAPKVQMECSDLPDSNGKYDCKPIILEY